MKLTTRQRAVLAAIVTLTEDAGAPPSLREIGNSVGLGSTAAVRHQVGVLEAAGLLRPRPSGRHRSLVLAEGVAMSRNGLVARAVAVSHCPRCLLCLPVDHDCHARIQPDTSVQNGPS